MTHRHDHQSSGQTLPLFAIMVPALLALMALGLDGAQIFLERRDAQAAADLAALAGARSLPDDAAEAENDAVAIALANGFVISKDADVETPYDSDDTKIEVTVSAEVGTFFMPILDMFLPGEYSTVDISARAVAQSQQEPSTGGGYAMFSLETDCDADEAYKAIDWSGSNNNVTGSVHSDTSILMGGSSNSIVGPTTFNCDLDLSGSDNTFDPDPVAKDAEPPLAFDYADYNNASVCDFYGPTDDTWDLHSDSSVWQDATTLKSGVYCTRASGDKATIILSRQYASGTVTFVAGYSVDLPASNVTLDPYIDGILNFSNGPDEKAIMWQAGQRW
jgi:hypothetical protein